MLPRNDHNIRLNLIRISTCEDYFDICFLLQEYCKCSAPCRSANHIAHWASLVIGVISRGAQQAAGAFASLTVDIRRQIVGMALLRHGHAKDILADTNMLAGTLLIVQTLIHVRLEHATMMMHCLEAAFAIEGIALLALAHCNAVAAFAALDVHHNVAHLRAV